MCKYKRPGEAVVMEDAPAFGARIVADLTGK